MKEQLSSLTSQFLSHNYNLVNSCNSSMQAGLSPLGEFPNKMPNSFEFVPVFLKQTANDDSME